MIIGDNFNDKITGEGFAFLLSTFFFVGKTGISRLITEYYFAPYFFLIFLIFLAD